MSIYASNVFATQMTNLVKATYLDYAKLMNTTRKVSGIIGGTYEFINAGYNLAREVTSGEAVQPNNTKFNKIQVILKDYASADYTNIFDKPKMTFDEINYLSKSISGALGRKIDQIILDTITATVPVNTKPTIDNPNVTILKGDGTFPTSATTPVAADRVAFSLSALRKASSIMNDLGVPSMGRAFVLTPAALEALLADTTVTSTDYNTVKALVTGELDTYVGFKIIFIGQRPDGGLPPSIYTTGANGGTAYAYHEDSIGMVTAMEPKVLVNYIADKRSYLVDGMVSAAAGVIDKNGIIKIIHGSV